MNDTAGNTPPPITSEGEKQIATQEWEKRVVWIKTFRRDLDSVLGLIKTIHPGSRETSLAITKAQEAIMWLGMELKRLNDLPENPTRQRQMIETKVVLTELAKTSYTKYRNHTGGKSLASGLPIPEWDDLPETIKSAWIAAVTPTELAPSASNPYPNSYDPSNTKIEPTADGLKL